MSKDRLVDVIREHGHDAWINPFTGKIFVEEVYSQAGTKVVEYVDIEPTLRTVKEWLGY
jgi:hypothetical protein